MKLRNFAFLADENMHMEVVEHWRKQGLDIVAVKEVGLLATSDVTVMRYAVSQNRLVLTQDSDFGTLAILDGEPITGIVYLRPGHIKPAFTIGTMETLFAREIDVEPPFIIVAERTASTVKIRVRKM